MTGKAPTIRPTKAPAAGAGRPVGGRPGMSAGLSEQDGCGGKRQEGEQSKCERIRSRTLALSRTRSHQQLLKWLCGYLRH